MKNGIAQLFFGLPLELSGGSIRIAQVYLTGIFLGGLGRELTSHAPHVPLLGASGNPTMNKTILIHIIFTVNLILRPLL